MSNRFNRDYKKGSRHICARCFWGQQRSMRYPGCRICDCKEKVERTGITTRHGNYGRNCEQFKSREEVLNQ